MAIGFRPNLGMTLQGIVAGDQPPFEFPRMPGQPAPTMPPMDGSPPKPRSKGHMIAGIIGDALLGLAGQQGVYAPMAARERQQRQQQELENVQWSRRHQVENDDWMAHQQYEQTHRAPDAFDTHLEQSGVVRGSPGWLAAQKQYTANMQNPMMAVATTDAQGKPAYTWVPRNGTAPARPSGPPAAAIQHLQQNPGLKADFDAKYGSGAADRILGGGAGNGAGGFHVPSGNPLDPWPR